MTAHKKTRFRSQDWFDNKEHIDLTALYLERFMNYGITPEELRSGKPIIGIAQSGSDLAPCNRIHIELAARVKDGIQAAGGIPIEFPSHPIFENCRRPTAALDRNLAYLGLVEILYGYPIDGVVFTTGCDKTTPSSLMAASTVDIPSIVLSGGPMLDGWHNNELVGSGTVIWRSRKRLAAGEIDEEEFLNLAMSSAPSAGHCNTMGTALTMNSVAEALGMSLTGCAAIPAPYRERGQIAYRTGERIVKMVYEDLVPSRILTRAAFINAMKLIAAIGGSTNAQPHLMAMAKHAGVEISAQDWNELARPIPLLVNVQPSGEFLGERFHRAGGVPAVLWELLEAGELDGDVLTVSGHLLKDNIQGKQTSDRAVIKPFNAPMLDNAGFAVLSGNFFDFAIMKTSVISPDFKQRFLSQPGSEGVFNARAVVFENAEDYHKNINNPALNIDASCILVLRGAGPVGWPGSAEVVNMQPPNYLIEKGITSLPTLGDGRQSGTSDSPSILHVSPESSTGGGLAYIESGDMLRIDLINGKCDVALSQEEMAKRKQNKTLSTPVSDTPWQEIYRSTVSDLSQGGIIELATKYHKISHKLPRHNH
ncbi:IlvD/Edd family dehydratase [Aliiglaciecola lipolytica]|uniref:IlvD/Edd family dehydratase n=1 Tax=Aliiglaciecola lipolytica TaxID=477689 RepID=UPI001C083EC4|nr:IlvD/Edd family dehydratase [Aliiglaciecola lipolytica]MBU2879912.1 dihydroxy-acid dehydratase family protein [Aliiglaciecola lipolytica]